ncbi:MAG: hypothetical protein PF518_10915 [Spirochaetaceae bacterium]|jgi:hypothetical protein|nr:hypothetical protein [Spirochaetaceae bacterium]
MDDKMREALKRVTDKLIALDADVFEEKLKSHKDGVLSQLVVDTDFDIIFDELSLEESGYVFEDSEIMSASDPYSGTVNTGDCYGSLASSSYEKVEVDNKPLGEDNCLALAA